MFNSGIALEIAGIAIALVVNVGIFLFAFGVMTRSRQGWLEMLPGAIAASVAVVVLLRLGTFIVGRYITGASDTYGTFAVVIALLSWFYLVSRIILLGAELNGVLANELWPRSITADSDLTEGDRRAVTLDAGRQPTRQPHRDRGDGGAGPDGVRGARGTRSRRRATALTSGVGRPPTRRRGTRR